MTLPKEGFFPWKPFRGYLAKEVLLKPKTEKKVIFKKNIHNKSVSTPPPKKRFRVFSRNLLGPNPSSARVRGSKKIFDFLTKPPISSFDKGKSDPSKASS